MTPAKERKTRWLTWIALALLAAPGAASSAPQTDNAALLYYQAMLLCGKPDDTMMNLLSAFSKWEISANAALREHVEKNRRVIDYLVTAANMAQCDWAYDYSQGLDLALPNLPNKRLVYLLLADGRLLAEQGDYATALDRCLTVHKMALHYTDRVVITYLVGVASSGLANIAIQETLGIIPQDVKVLSRLKTQLSQFQAAFPSVANVIAREGEVCAVTMRKEGAQTFLRMVEEGGDSDEARMLVARVQEADDAFFEKNHQHWFNSIAAVTGTLESGLPYEQMYAALDELGKRICDEGRDNPDATLTAFSLPATRRIYQLAVRQQTHFNAIRTAIDIYLAKAATGRLPDALPAGAPLDLFSGRPFEYEKAGDRFILRCRVKEDPEKAEANQYEFKIKQ